MKLSSLNTANPSGRLLAVALLSMFSVGGTLVAMNIIQPSHLEMPSKPAALQQADTPNEWEFLARQAVSSNEMPETIVTPKAVYTRYQVGARYYFFSGGQLVASGTQALPKLPRPSVRAAR